MTIPNTDLVRTICAAGRALSAMPLDELPVICAVVFDERIDRRTTEVRVSAQLGADAVPTTGDAVRAVLAWQQAMPGDSSLRATQLPATLRGSHAGGWKLVARGHMPGTCADDIWVDVWTIVQPAAPTDARMADAGSDEAAAAVLVQSAALARIPGLGAQPMRPTPPNR